MTSYPLEVHGAIREWRVRSKRVFDIIIDAPANMTWNDHSYRRNAALFHLQEFTGPASGPIICYQRPIVPGERIETLFGGVDADFFGPRQGNNSIGPVGLDLIEAVEAVPAADVQELLQRERQMAGDDDIQTGFIHASSLLRPNGTRAVLAHVAVSQPQVEELFVWVLAHKEEPQEMVFTAVRQYLNKAGLKPIDNLIEYVGLPFTHPTGVIEEAFDLRIRRRVR